MSLVLFWRERVSGGAVSRYRWVVVALVVAFVTTMFVAGGRGDAATSYDSEELQFLSLINQYREENGVEPLILSDTLTLASERHSKDMGDYGFFAHDTVESSYYAAGSEPWDRMEAEGYDYNTAKGENLAAGHETAEGSFQAWRESPAHNEAMLNGDYRVVGVARLHVPGSVHGWYWTTDFGGFADPSSHAPGTPQDPEPPDETVPTDENVEEREPEQVPERDTGRIENGAMNGEGVWDQRAADGADLIFDDGYALLGGYDDGKDELRQKIRVTKTSRLAYVLKIQSDEPRGPEVDDRREPDDRMLVRITDTEGKQLAVLDKYTADDRTGWDRDVVDLSRFAGRTVYLSFQVRTNPTLTTTFYLDTVMLKKGEGGAKREGGSSGP